MYNTTIQQYYNVSASVHLCVSLHSPCCSKMCIFKSDSTACISYQMWNRVPCSHGSMSYCAPPIVCAGLGDCEEISGGMSCEACMDVRVVC